MKWICTVIQDGNGKYRAVMEIGGQTVYGLPEHVPYKTLRDAIKLKTGIEILKQKEMFWERLSDFEKIATIDNTQCRNDCRVTVKERIDGWQPCWD